MSDVVPGPRPVPVVRYIGVLDLDGLYSLIVSWFKDNQYNFKEEKHEFKPDKLGKELKIVWTGDKKVTEYVKYIISITLIIYEMNNVEVVENGVKKKKVKGRLDLRINAKADLDYQDRWETSEFNFKLRKFYHKYILRFYIDFKVWNPFYYKIWGLLTDIKKFLNMETGSNAY